MTVSDAKENLFPVQTENYRYASAEKERAEMMRKGILFSLAEQQDFPLRGDEAAEVFRTVSGDSVCSLAFAYFCRCLAERNRITLSDWTSETEDNTAAIVSFMRSADTDDLLLALRKEGEWAERLVSSAAEVCRDVSEGRSRGGLLPVFSQADGPLLYFRKMIRRYELCISAVFEKYIPETDNALQYALLTRENVSAFQRRDYLDVLFPFAAFDNMGVLTDVARMMDTPIKGFHVLPSDSGSGKEQLLLTLGVKPEVLSATRLFLSVAFPEAEITGYYHIIKMGENVFS